MNHTSFIKEYSLSYGNTCKSWLPERRNNKKTSGLSLHDEAGSSDNSHMPFLSSRCLCRLIEFLAARNTSGTGFTPQYVYQAFHRLSYHDQDASITTLIQSHRLDGVAGMYVVPLVIDFHHYNLQCNTVGTESTWYPLSHCREHFPISNKMASQRLLSAGESLCAIPIVYPYLLRSGKFSRVWETLVWGWVISFGAWLWPACFLCCHLFDCTE